MLNKLGLFATVAVIIHLLTYLPGYDQLFRNVSLIFFNLIVSWQVAAVILNKFYRRFFIASLQTSDKVVLISGCDTGFGNLFARYLNGKGYHVFASCLSKESLKELKEQAREPAKMFPFLMDITKDEQIESCSKLVENYLSEHPEAKFWALINNAGIASPGELEFGEFDRQYRTVFEVNVFGTAKLTRKFLPLIRRYSNVRNSSALNGRVININSLAGRCAITPTSIYSMSKHASVAFTEALRNEMHKFHIKVISIEPYYYETMQTNPKRLLDAFDNCWNSTDPLVRQDYGANYVDKVKSLIDDKDFRKTVSRNAVDVARVVHEALSSYDPEDKYICSDSVMKVGLQLLNFVPREFVDLFVRSMQFKFATDRVD